MKTKTYSNTIALLEPKHSVLYSLTGTLPSDSGALQVVCSKDVMASIEGHVTATVLTAVKHWKRWEELELSGLQRRTHDAEFIIFPT